MGQEEEELMKVQLPRLPGDGSGRRVSPLDPDPGRRHSGRERSGNINLWRSFHWPVARKTR